MRRRLRRAAIVAGAVLTALVVGCTALFATWLAGVRIPIASGATHYRVTKIQPGGAADRIGGAPTDVFFVLLVGNDERPGIGGARGDALHLVGVNPQLNRATMLNIPRDTCWNGDKINAANTNGPRASAEAVGGLIGVPVSYVIDVNFAGFTALVDGAGGVDVNVPTDMNDGNSGAYFPAGLQHMNGGQALAFSRDRYDFPTGDIARSQNQGLLILDAMKGLREDMQNAPGEFRLLALLGRHARLDGIGVKDLYRLGRVAFALDPARIANITIPVGGGNCMGLGGAASSLFADFRADGIVDP